MGVANCLLGCWDDLAGGNNLAGLGIFFVIFIFLVAFLVVILSMRVRESIVLTVKESGINVLLVSVLSSLSEESGTE